MKCPCGNNNDFNDCCGPIIQGTKPAQTAEELMRSRYSAFAQGEADYILSSTHPDTRGELDLAEIKVWANESKWMGLTIIATDSGLKEDTSGVVEFNASYQNNQHDYNHREIAEFKKIDDSWFFLDGEVQPHTLKRSGPKVGRNDPCFCGSGKKYKKCCL